MSGQTSYVETPEIGFAGMICEHFSLRQIDSGLVETAAIAVGSALNNGTADAQYKTAIVNAPVTGVAVYEPTQENQSGSYTYPVKGHLPVMKQGRFYGVASGALAKGASVAMVIASGKYAAPVTDTTTGIVGKLVTSSAADGDLVEIELKLDDSVLLT